MTFDQLMKAAWQRPSDEDALREKLLLAETRIFQLEREVKMLRGSFPASGPSPEAVAPKVRKKLTKSSFPEMKFIRMRYPESFGENAPKAAHKYTDAPLPSSTYVFRAFCGRCFYCGCQLQEHTVTVDHQIPKSKGGTRARNNVVAACMPCNNAKGNRMPTEQELERANVIRYAYDNRPPNAEPMIPDVVEQPEKQPLRPSSIYSVRREKSLAEIEQDIQDKMATERELFGNATAR